MTVEERIKAVCALDAYEVIENRRIDDLDSTGMLLKHKKTGARIAVLINDDDNKVFSIGFRTPPTDSTGVAHIIEHSVLCGSDKYPVKDPFIELAKGSLNTFLNAMTYPDKTVYPIASCNDRDYKNLMDVYLDAVFHPNIYKEKKIFMQEGWHYEIENAEDPVKINGVVYNEMKGAFSSPDDVVEREILNALFPDTAYGVESGGDPLFIPDLTYEAFLDFHSRYYHPSNSYIYLYGDCDMAERLKYIDEEYLSGYDRLEIDSAIRKQECFDKPRYLVKEYPIAENDSEKEHTYLTYSFAMEDNLDKEAYIAFDVLDYAVCSAPGAPLKKALIDAGIGKDVYSEYENGSMQPYFSVIAKDTDADRQDDFIRIVEDVLKEQAAGGLDHTSLLAALNVFEFKYREADFGSYPKGLMIGLQMFDSWLYDENSPFLHIEANDTYASLKKRVETGYFENLIETKLLGNNHKAIVTVVPKKGLTTKRDNELAEKLAAYKASLSAGEIDELVAETKALADYQESGDAQEDLEKIPLLTRADLKKEAPEYVNEEKKIGDIPVLYHDIFTNGIGYIRFMFDMKNVPADYWSYAGALKSFIGLMNTENYTYGELFNEMNLKTGGIAPVNNIFPIADSDGDCIITLEMKSKVLYENIPEAVRLIREMIVGTDYSDEERLVELIDEVKSHIQGAFMSSGHNLAATSAASTFSSIDATVSATNGIPFLRLFERLSEDFDANKAELISRLNELNNMIFRKENLRVDYIGSRESYEKLAECIPEFADSLFDGELNKTGSFVAPSGSSHAYTSASQVQYVARVGNYKDKGLKYDGSLKVLKVMMGYDYLWNQVRVRGGAYGCMCQFGRTGKSYFVSYRDPNLERTVDVYEKAADYIRNYDADERTMTQYVIGAISELDTPMTPSRRGQFSLDGYMTHITHEMLQQERDAVLTADAAKIRTLADYIDAFMDTKAFCVVGGEDKIKEAGNMFDVIEPLFS